jgi:hypothetical protein
LNLLPGNATIMYSTGPIDMWFPLSASLRLPALAVGRQHYLTNRPVASPVPNDAARVRMREDARRTEEEDRSG